MSVFHQLKNIFRNNSSKFSLGSSEAKVHRKEAVERIVKEESIAKSKLPEYEGLQDQYDLIKKLGEYVPFPCALRNCIIKHYDRGAFSNVYEAIDKKTGQHVAIKIVRKFELSQIQVIITKKKITGSSPFAPLLLSFV